MSDERRTGDDLLRRLLGPDEPELTCEACFEEIDRYVELELAQGPERADALLPGMSAHLEGCRACAEEHASLVALLHDDRPSAGR
ncbi:MAG TPA: hypothetical protein VHB30_00790 [Solirubrobacteraceae bacterium]|jgi:hypothetical protein|nr:hypothetical protein [Solirubrobacteraceae bacterium]